MSGYIKHFDDGGKFFSFKIEDEGVYSRYNGFWNKIKKTINLRFHSHPIHDDIYIKAKVKTFNCAINRLFSDKKIPKEGNHYVFIAAICIDS